MLQEKNFKRSRYRENDFVELWVEKNTIVEVFKKDVIIDLEAGKQIVIDRLIVSNGEYMPIFVDARGLASMDKSASDYLTTEEATDLLTHGAFLVSNTLHKIMINFFLKFKTPKIPTRFFKKETDARFWIEELRKPDFSNLSQN